MSGVTEEPQFHTSGIVRLTRPQLAGTMTGLVLAMFLAALDQTIVGTAEPRIIASLSGFNRYPWVATAYLLTSTLVVPIIAKLSDLWGRKWFFLWGSAVFASTIFFRAIGSTVGVALFGSVLLTNYHAEFSRRLPPGVPPEDLDLFNHPLLLIQMRPQMEAVFSRYPNGLELMQTLMVNVRESLVHGLHLIFVSSACVMGGAVVLNLLLKNVPLRTHHHAPSAEPAVH